MFLEALVAMGLVSGVLTAVLPAFMLCLQTHTRNERRSEAIAVAQAAMEDLRQRPVASLALTGSEGPTAVAMGPRSYDVTIRFCANPTLCLAETRHVQVEVELDGRLFFSVESILTEFG